MTKKKAERQPFAAAAFLRDYSVTVKYSKVTAMLLK